MNSINVRYLIGKNGKSDDWFMLRFYQDGNQSPNKLVEVRTTINSNTIILILHCAHSLKLTIACLIHLD